MKTMRICGLLMIFVFLLSMISPSKQVIIPKHFPEPVYDFEANPMNDTVVQLGRALFYDPILSKDGTISCASCHSPYNGFAHTDHRLSHGINDKIGFRNAPALFNLAWQSSFMWDGAIHNLHAQALHPITSANEMGESLENVLKKLNNSTLYRKLFAEAYGDPLIDSQRLLSSLAQFQLTLVSSQSKYDDVVNGLDDFTEVEGKGYQIFKKKCASCHVEPLFTSGDFESNGLMVDSTLQDVGRAKITLRASDNYKFKVPSLRNLSYTYPYMHDGRFDHIREILDHYNGLKIGDLEEPIHLSADDKTELINFLLCLDDKRFIFNQNNKFPREILLPSNN